MSIHVHRLSIRKLVIGVAVALSLTLSLAPLSPSYGRTLSRSPGAVTSDPLARKVVTMLPGRQLPPGLRDLRASLLENATVVTQMTAPIRNVNSEELEKLPYNRNLLSIIAVTTPTTTVVNASVNLQRRTDENDSWQRHSWSFQLGTDSFSYNRRMTRARTSSGEFLGDYGSFQFNWRGTDELKKKSDECTSIKKRHGRLSGTLSFDFQNNFFGTASLTTGRARLLREVIRTGEDCTPEPPKCRFGLDLSIAADNAAPGETSYLGMFRPARGLVTQNAYRFFQEEPAYISSYAYSWGPRSNFTYMGSLTDVDTAQVSGLMPFFGGLSNFATETRSGPTMDRCGSTYMFSGSFDKGLTTYWDGGADHSYSANGTRTYAGIRSTY